MANNTLLISLGLGCSDGVVIPLSEKVPFGLYVMNLHYLADLFGTGVEVDGVVIPLGEKVPSGLYVMISITFLICLGLG